MGNTFKLGKLVNGLNVLDNGNVGINTSTVTNSMAQINTAGSAGNEVALRLRNPSGSFSDCTTSIYFQGGYTTNLEGISAITGGRESASNVGYLTLSTSNGTSLLERMRITSFGSVGIGTNNVSAEANLFLGAIGTTEGGQLVLQKGTTQTFGVHLDNFSDRFRIISGTDTATSVERMCVLLNNGNVGIGTTSPFNFGAGHKTLDVRGDGTTSIGALFVGNSDRTAVLGFYMNPNATGTVGTSSNHALQLVTNDAERIRITPTGNVCIGTSTSSGYGNINLDLNAAALPAAYFVIRTGSNSVTAEYAVDGGVAYLSTKTAHPLVLRTSDVERMRITSGGFIGIGTSSPATRLEVTSSGSSWISGNFAGLTSTDKVVIGAYPGVGAAVGGHNNALSAWAPLSFNFGGGAVYAGSQRIDNNSDARVKENIVNVENALDTILKLQGRKFNMIDEDNILRYGFIAQEVQPVLSDFVKESNREYKDKNTHIEKLLTLETSGASWAALLVEAIKELKAEIEILKNK
jgi:hypothetical protein